MTTRSLYLLAAALVFTPACASGDAGADTPTPAPEADSADLSASTATYFALGAEKGAIVAHSNHPFLCSPGVRASSCAATLDWAPLGPGAAVASLDQLARAGRLVVRGSWSKGTIGVREVLVRAGEDVADDQALTALAALAPVVASAPPGLCGEALRAALEAPVKGLLWPSESDYPITVSVGAPGGTGAISDKELRGLAGAASDVAIEDRGTRPLDQLGEEYPGIDDVGKAQAARFRDLRAVLAANLSGVSVRYVGSIDRKVLALGRSRCGEVAGVISEVIET